MRKIWLMKLEEIVAERGLNAKQLSKAAGLSDTYVWDLLNRNVDPTITKLGALADALSLPIGYFLTDEVHRVPTIPVVGFASGGEEWTPIDDNGDLPQLDFVSLDLTGSDAIAIRVRGHSMSPVFRDGDDLVCSRQRGQDMRMAIAQDCVVKTMNNKFYVKHVLKGTVKNTFRLRSYNPAFEDIENVALEWAAPVTWIRRNGR
jgi:phage repressor protein C with HTH and peptisase S24 domain